PGRHAVDEFLFTNQRGYCEHYAGAFVFFLRAAGIPARVVVGYQGGEWLSEEQYLLVSQADAHAWAEVWLPAKGWQRYDPTSAVAPERIELGFREYIERASASGMEQAADFRQAAFLTMLRLRLDVLNYSWQSWVLGYNQEQQMQLFERFLGGREYWRIGALLLIGASLIMGCFGFVLWWRTRPLPPPANLKPWLALEQRLRRYGYKREQGETPQQFVQRVGRDYPSAQPLLSRFSQMAYRLLYEAEQDSDSQQKLQRQMRRLLATLKLETGNR
ncbi:MAG: transglutaminase domain-containing protein, partial [Cellvibrionaceae bacterium]|nr:transglutaminase domain-containing protein [Cellvibrionaceae bacterium]